MARNVNDFLFEATPERTFAVIAKIDTKSIVQELARDANTKVGKWAKESFSSSLRSKILRERIAIMHEELGEDVRKEIIRAYKAGKKRGVSSYREGDTGKLKRYSNGQMDKGLSDPAFIVTSPRGIGISPSILDTYARQWARLNFGTAPKGSKAVKMEKIQLFRKSLSDSPSLSRFGARPSFRVPGSGRVVGTTSTVAYDMTPSTQAMVRTPAGKKYLYVYPYPGKGLGKRKFISRTSKGILGWRFLDQGVSYMNKEYGKRLTGVLDTWVKEIEKGAQKSASNQSRKTRNIKVTADPEFEKRSTAAKKGWETRRKNQAARSAAASKGWETRRRNRATPGRVGSVVIPKFRRF